VQPRQGRILMSFNCTLDSPAKVDPRMLHAGRPVLEGEKWAANKWLRMFPLRSEGEYDYDCPISQPIGSCTLIDSGCRPPRLQPPPIMIGVASGGGLAAQLPHQARTICPAPSATPSAARPPRARKVSGWPKRCKLAHAFQCWEYSYGSKSADSPPKATGHVGGGQKPNAMFANTCQIKNSPIVERERESRDAHDTTI
jgi:hypothetical protein